MLRKRSRDLSAFLAALAISTPAFAQPPKEIRITANEFSFKPSKIRVSQGEVQITVSNRGKFRHGIALVGREDKISYIESGETKNLTLHLDKDEELVFYCSQPGHRKKGMEGKLRIRSP
jgi:uncharacterized cupredoxin-like copper-binding protein